MLSFYDELWEVKYVFLKNFEMKRFFFKVKDLVLFIGDYRSKKFYEDVLKVGVYLFVK